MKIRELSKKENAPLDLLLLADPSEEMVLTYLHRGSCFLAEIDDEIMGEYVLLETGPQTAEIVNIAVAAEQQGKGIGKKLVTHAISKAKELGYHHLEIGTGNSSIHQLLLYQKCGFRINRIEHNYFINHYKEEIIENGIRCSDKIVLAMELKELL
ncbi:GNAT family N-acetyltransferase [Cytobacillus gottheilii]|uniref:GNAT family N-acetyltransferase n=1 Tax=Cytobacillus gottheilii TaxID=859144 RepID=UPI0009B9A55D|nr:GNAT family N-acetyltransferase [Cytobacillus gottheilii]